MMYRQRMAQATTSALMGWALVVQAGLAAEIPAGPERWERDIAAFEAADRTNPPPRNAVLFIGSSSIRLWKTLSSDFPEHRVINRGFGGSEISDTVHFTDRVVLPYRPRLIVMYAGGNDINAGESPEQLLADFKEFVTRVHAALPQTRIAYISVAPNPARWSQADRIRAANQLIRDFTRRDARVRVIDDFTAMLGGDGAPRPELFVDDQLHMNAEGYALW